MKCGKYGQPMRTCNEQQGAAVDGCNLSTPKKKEKEAAARVALGLSGRKDGVLRGARLFDGGLGLWKSSGREKTSLCDRGE